MCLKDDIKKAKNSSTIVLSSVNDEGVNLGVNSSEFTITLPPFPNAQNYNQCLIQLKSLHCAPTWPMGAAGTSSMPIKAQHRAAAHFAHKYRK